MTEQVTDTGIRGFLAWLSQQQPEIAAHVLTVLPTQVPQAFGDYHAGGWRTAGKSQDEALNASLAGLGQTDTGTGCPAGQTDYGFGCVDLTTGLLSPMPAPVSTVTAANAGQASTATTSLIGGIVQGISALYLTKQQADIQQQVVNTQLQRAAAGLPPLPTSLANLGVPQVSVGLSSGTGTGIIIAGAVLLGILIFGGTKKRA
ncbi:MAG: hypothetical protein ACREQ5_02945 [Candidatus Dormibacteria bacterium]